MRELLLAIDEDILRYSWPTGCEINLQYLEMILCPYNLLFSNNFKCCRLCFFYAFGLRLRFMPAAEQQSHGCCRFSVPDCIWPVPTVHTRTKNFLLKSNYYACFDPGYIAHRLCCYGLLAVLIGTWGYLLDRI